MSTKPPCPPWVTDSVSAAIGQRSLGNGALFPLYPPLVFGCPQSSDDEMQMPLCIAYDPARLHPATLCQAPLPGLDRWAPFLPPLAPGLSLGEGGTPLLPSASLGAWAGLDGPLWLKDESRNPSGSHKDRLALCVVSAAVATGAPGVAVASTGNHGAAIAAYAARAGIGCVVVTSPDAQPAFGAMLAAYGANIVAVPTQQRQGALRDITGGTGFMPASNLTRFHTGHPFGPEGYKTIAFEIFRQMSGSMPGSVIVPTGYGELLFGIGQGFAQIVALGLADRVPRLFSAEPAVRAPLHRAMQMQLPAAEVVGAPSRAAGIACLVGGVRARYALDESDGAALVFSEEMILRAARRLAGQGLWQEYSGAAGVAAIRQARDAGVDMPGPVVAILTSGGWKDVVPEDRSDMVTADGIAALMGRLRDG